MMVGAGGAANDGVAIADIVLSRTPEQTMAQPSRWCGASMAEEREGAMIVPAVGGDAVGRRSEPRRRGRSPDAGAHSSLTYRRPNFSMVFMGKTGNDTDNYPISSSSYMLGSNVFDLTVLSLRFILLRI